MTTVLSRGAVRQIHDMHTGLRPTLQVHDLRKLQPSPQQQQAASGVGDRYRVVLSDGESLLQCILMSQLNELVVSGRLERGCIVSLLDYQPNVVQNRVVAIILNLEVIGEAVPSIGSPTAHDPSGNKAPADGNGSRPDAAGSETRPPAMSSPPPPPSARSTKMAHSSAVVRDDEYALPTLAGTGKPVVSTAPGGASGAAPPPGGYTKICAANPFQNNVIIRGRVVQKGELRTYTNARGDGKLFSFEVADETGTLRVTAFREKAVEAYEQVELNGVYSIAGASLKPANVQYNHTGHAFEMILDQSSVLTQLPDDGSIRKVAFDFVKIGKLEQVLAGVVVDVIGIIVQADELREVVSKSSGSLLSKRDVKVADDTGRSVTLTVWGERARSLQLDPERHPVILVKGAKRGDFNGVSLSSTPGSYIELNPDIAEAHALRGWFDSVGHSAAMHDLSSSAAGAGAAGQEARLKSGERKTFAQVQEEHIGEDPTAGPAHSYYNVRATISIIKHDEERPPWYNSCPDCKKKVIEEAAQAYRCEKCDKPVEPVPRYVFSFQAMDATGSHWMNCYDEAGSVILGGYKASELMHLRQTDPEAYNNVFEDAKYAEFVFRVRVRSDTYQDEMQYRHMVVAAERVDFDTERSMIEREIAKYEQAGAAPNRAAATAVAM